MQVIFVIVLKVILRAVFQTLHGSTVTYEHSATTHILYIMLVSLW